MRKFIILTLAIIVQIRKISEEKSANIERQDILFYDVPSMLGGVWLCHKKILFPLFSIFGLGLLIRFLLAH